MNNSSDSDKSNIANKNFPIDLAQKIAMVKPTENKGATVQTQQTFRAITQPQMRMIAMPAGAVQTSGTAQIIQTHIMPPTMLKQVDPSTRAQITTIPARSQGTSITVSRAPTPSNFISRSPSITNTNLRGTINTSIRTPTPPVSLTNLGSAFVRGNVPPKTPSPAGATVLSPGSTQTWLSSGNAVQVQVPTQIIRAANITTQSPRQQQTRMIGQTATTTTIGANNTNTIVNTVSQNNQNVTSQTQQPTFVAATVLPGRQPAATLVYSNISNPQQQYVSGGQRLAVTTSLGGQRQVRPIQFTNARLPTAGVGLRVSTANISIRAPSVPVLAPTSVLTSLPSSVQGRAGATVSTTNISTSIPTARIIQVQQPQGGGPAQVINASRLGATNVMTLHPVIVNAAPGGNRISTTLSTKVQPSLTITQVKSTLPINTNVGSITVVTQSQASQQTTQTVAGSNSGSNQQTLTSQQQIAQIVSINQQGVVNQSHQIVTVSQPQLIGNQNQGIATVVPIAINSRTTNVLTGTITSIQPQSISNTANRTGNIIPVSSGTTILPIAKVLPQQQQITTEQSNSTSVANTSVGQQQVLIHTRSPSTANTGNATANVLPSSGTFLPTSGTFYYEHSSHPNNGNQVLTLTTSNVNQGSSTSGTNIPNNLGTSVAYASSNGSFAVVQANSRTVNQIHGIVPTSNQSHTTQIQSVPLRFNPQLIVDTAQGHQGAHQIITMSQPASGAQNQNASGVLNTSVGTQPQQSQQTHVLIPVTTKLASSSPRPSILKKRENESSPTIVHHSLKAAKNLNPTLLSMSASVHEREMERERDPSPHSRPGSSEGSTTISATSSPGIDQQEQEEMAMSLNMRLSSDMQFKPVENVFSNVNVTTSQQIPIVPQATMATIGHQIQHQSLVASGAENNNDMTPRKKPRKQHLDASENLEPNLQYMNDDAMMYSMENNIKTNNVTNNKENAQPMELTIKKPKASLLENYKQTWKPANNHFQRYSDVKPREERRPNVMDLANQAHVVQKVNGWKIYHLSSQMEDLCELESQVHGKLANMLQYMEAHESCPDIDRVNDLIKGNMQRSKVIIDGVNEARTQIMKIFDHKAHVSDIIHRCASKRNFKKREKM